MNQDKPYSLYNIVTDHELLCVCACVHGFLSACNVNLKFFVYTLGAGENKSNLIIVEILGRS